MLFHVEICLFHLEVYTLHLGSVPSQHIVLQQTSYPVTAFLADTTVDAQGDSQIREQYNTWYRFQGFKIPLCNISHSCLSWRWALKGPWYKNIVLSTCPACLLMSKVVLAELFMVQLDLWHQITVDFERMHHLHIYMRCINSYQR